MTLTYTPTRGELEAAKANLQQELTRQQTESAHIRAQLVTTLREARSDRLYIRTSPHDRVAVTVVGRSAAGPGLSDEDAVELWREIPRAAEAVAEGSG